MRWQLLLRAGLITVICFTPLATSVAQKMVHGAGRVSCGAWLEFRAARANPQDMRFTQAREWLDGFLSAYNWYVFSGPDVRATDSDGMYAWIDKFCRENPTAGLVFAMAKFIAFLEQRK